MTETSKPKYRLPEHRKRITITLSPDTYQMLLEDIAEEKIHGFDWTVSRLIDVMLWTELVRERQQKN